MECWTGGGFGWTTSGDLLAKTGDLVRQFGSFPLSLLSNWHTPDLGGNLQLTLSVVESCSHLAEFPLASLI